MGVQSYVFVRSRWQPRSRRGPRSRRPRKRAPAVPKQVRIIIASVPGAGPDFISRLMAPKLSEALRSNVVVENRPGTNGIVAAQFTAKSRAGRLRADDGQRRHARDQRRAVPEARIRPGDRLRADQRNRCDAARARRPPGRAREDR